MSACAWPEEVAPPPYDEATLAADDLPFISAFCHMCGSQVIGPDPVTIAHDLLAHVTAVHQ